MECKFYCDSCAEHLLTVLFGSARMRIKVSLLKGMPARLHIVHRCIVRLIRLSHYSQEAQQQQGQAWSGTRTQT